jgi:RNA polymerase sigma factor (sigma-70 family)
MVGPVGGIAAVSFDTMFRRSFAGVARVAAMITGDREVGREIAQEAFTRLVVHWDRVSEHERPDAWVRRVAIRMAVREARRRRDVPVESSAADDVGSVGARLEVRRAVLTLPAQQRAVVVLHFFEDLPLVDVARLIGCRPATARVHLHRARSRLAELLREVPEEVADAARTARS